MGSTGVVEADPLSDDALGYSGLRPHRLSQELLELAVLALELLHGRPSLHLLQESDDLLVSESRLLHARTLLRKSDATHLPVVLKTGVSLVLFISNLGSKFAV